MLIDFPNGGVATYAHDAFGRRIEKNVDGVIARYFHDDDDNIVIEFYGANTLVAR